MSGLLEFGTAGLRGALGAGPNRMNRSVVIRAAAGLTAYLKDEGRAGEAPTVVIGFDARYNSDVFARDTAAVVVAAGAARCCSPQPLPTPVLAFAIRHLGADAGVMVTASHNPPQDNGYKVYLGDGSQIVPPADSQIAAHIARVERVADVPRAADGWKTLGDDLVEHYVDASSASSTPPRPETCARSTRACTGRPHHGAHRVRPGRLPGSGRRRRAGGARPGLPDRRLPQPRGEGRHRPRARPRPCGGVRPRHRQRPRRRPVRGGGPGPGPRRLADAAGRRGRRAARCAHRATGVSRRDVFANSIVSSRLLASIAKAAGLRHEETLTGFKWISRVDRLRYGYEEALGYCVAPQIVRDKDGVSAALLLAELAATLKAEGRTLTDLLDELYVEHGVHATDSFSVRVSDLAQTETLMARLRAEPPTTVAGVEVTRTDDLSRGDGGLPPTEGLRYHLADRSRVIVRPSGTEPKVKVYLEVIEPVATAATLAESRAVAETRLARVRADFEALTSL